MNRGNYKILLAVTPLVFAAYSGTGNAHTIAEGTSPQPVNLISSLQTAVATYPEKTRESKDYTSFFETGELRGAGWSQCLPGITWSLDTRNLEKSIARTEKERLRKIFSLWAKATGLTIAFTGNEKLRYNNSALTLNPVTSQTRSNHIYVGFYGTKQIPALSRNAVGLAKPTLSVGNQIVGGMAVFRGPYVTREISREPRQLNHLYLHELGHIFGLGHAKLSTNVMYPTLGTLTTLGPGDKAGAQKYTKECSTHA